jgi:hypothetical protein
MKIGIYGADTEQQDTLNFVSGYIQTQCVA